MADGAVVVTGASTGIGAETAAVLARDGFTVYAGVRSDADAERLAARHLAIRPLRLDVTDAAQIRTAAARLRADGMPLRGVVNNAGIAVGGPLEFLPLDELRRQFEVNVFGALAVTQAFLPALRETRGRVVFVGSISGRLGLPFLGPYSASKFALRALADALRGEVLATGIRVALIEPGSVRTPIWEKGRDGRERLLALLGREASQRYGPQLDALFRRTEREERSGMPVERVARAIRHALLARRPRASYLLGTPARAGAVVALLPASLRDRLLTPRGSG